MHKPKGMPIPAFELIYAEVKANQQRLDSCKRHHFPTLPPFTPSAKFTCSNCGGEMRHDCAAAYTRGYAAAGGDPNEIIPGWN